MKPIHFDLEPQVGDKIEGLDFGDVIITAIDRLDRRLWFATLEECANGKWQDTIWDQYRRRYYEVGAQ